MTVRTNLCVNPSFENDTAGWTNMSGTITRVTSTAYIGAACLQTPALSTLTLPFSYGFNSSNQGTSSAWDVIPGQTWTISFYAKTLSGSSNVGLRSIWLNSSNNFLSDNGNPDQVSCNSSTWTRVTSTVIVPASAAKMAFAPVGSAAIYMDAVQIEQLEPAGAAYFDGDTTDTALVTYAWTGTPGNSSSTATYAPVPAGGPQVVGVYTGLVTTTNPTVSVTDTPAAGDIIILATYAASGAGATAVTGLGATWARIPGGRGYMTSFWIGTGATASGTVTATAAMDSSGRVIRAYRLTGVTADVYAQPSDNTAMVRATSNQIILGFGASTTSTVGSSLTTKKPLTNAWTDQTEVPLTSTRRFNSSHLIPRWVADVQCEGTGGNGYVIVVGSPTGQTVTRRNQVHNSSLENGSYSLFGVNNMLSATVNTEQAMFGTKSLKHTSLSTATTTVTVNSNIKNTLAVVAGQTYTASCYIRSVNARNGRARIDWRDSNSGGLISSSLSSSVALPANTWVRVSITATAPAGAFFAQCGGDVTDAVNSDVTYWDGFLFEDGSTLGDYFDGFTTTAGRTNLFMGADSAWYTMQTMPPPAVTPSVQGVYTGAVTTGASITVNLPVTPNIGDVLLLCTGADNSAAAAIPTGVSGVGATWTKIGAKDYMTFWLGTGATSSGTITATATGTYNRALRVLHLRGVSSDYHIQQYRSASPVQATPDQIVIAAAYSQSATNPVISSESPPTGWTDDTELTLASSRRFNTAHIVPPYPVTGNVAGDSYSAILVFGVPIAGYSIARRNLVTEPSMETDRNTWQSNAITAFASSAAQQVQGLLSITGNYNGTGPSISKFLGANPPCGPVLPGHTYTVSGWVRSSVARNDVGIYPDWLSYGQGHVSYGAYTGSAIAANTWTRMSWTGVAPADVWYVGLFLKITDGASGDSYWFDAFMIEEAGTVGDYFDGSSAPPADNINAFVGPTDVYPSLQLAPPPPPSTHVHFKQRESGAWVAHTAVPKVRVAGAWVVKQGKYWNGSSWVNLP